MKKLMLTGLLLSNVLSPAYANEPTFNYLDQRVMPAALQDSLYWGTVRVNEEDTFFLLNLDTGELWLLPKQEHVPANKP